MRPLILSIFALFLAGCTHSQQSMVDTFRASLFDNQDITVADQQIQALPYSTMYLRLNEGQRIFVVLGYIEQEQSKWLSQDNAMLVTHNGRLLKTVKLNNNLLEVTNSGQDPLRNALAIKDGSRWTRDILWSEDNHFRSATLSSTFSFAGLETLNIAGRNVLSGRGDFHAARKTVAKHILGRFGYWPGSSKSANVRRRGYSRRNDVS